MSRDANRPPLTVAIPTFERGDVLLQTIHTLLSSEPRAAEILVVDQTPEHPPAVDAALRALETSGSIRWTRMARPSVTAAMNRALLDARSEVVLFLDDDVIPSPALLGSHAEAHAEDRGEIVAGQVLQPWEAGARPLQAGEPFRFSATEAGPVRGFMGGNFSVRLSTARELGGFDERFVGAAYHYERDFADRLLRSRGRIWFEPPASIRHLKVSAGGVRSFGDHLRTARHHHSAGEYYYLIRCGGVRAWLGMGGRFVRSVLTRQHLRHPWWIPATIIGELSGLAVGLWQAARGPLYLTAKLESR